jgi:predicted lipoprotein with Yx(FWY)xxD motif
MRSRGARFTAVTGSILTAGLLAAACSTSSSSGSGASAGAGAGTTSSPAASGGTVSTKSTSLGTVLVTSSGLTLYHLTTEHNGQVQCTGSCASIWPPYTVSAGTTPTGMSGLGTLMRPDGTTQVTYNGEALYRYSGDSASGDTNGNGISGVWFAVKSSGSTGSTGSSTSSGYNYGGGGY